MYRTFFRYFRDFLKWKIDVGDVCWRPNVLVTSHVTDIESKAPTSNISHQHHILAYYDVGDRCKPLTIAYLRLNSFFALRSLISGDDVITGSGPNQNFSIDFGVLGHTEFSSELCFP